MLTTTPRRRASSISFAQIAVAWNALVRLAAMTASHNAKSCTSQPAAPRLRSGELAMRPAQFTRTSGAPWRALKSPSAAAAAAPSAMSHVAAMTFEGRSPSGGRTSRAHTVQPAAAEWAARVKPSAPRSGGRPSRATTVQPAAAKWAARFKPISPELPVTTTRRLAVSDVNMPRREDFARRPLRREPLDFRGRQFDAESGLEPDDEL